MKKIWAALFILIGVIAAYNSVDTIVAQLDIVIILLGLILWYMPKDKENK